MNPTSTNPRVQDILRKIVPHLRKGYRILDIGSGSCEVAKILRDAGYNIMPLDVVNKSFYPNVLPVLYDGKHLPFRDNSFDIVLLITVLHHIKQPVEILKEAVRVAPKIIVMEDLYRGIFQKYMTFAMDSLLNSEFFGHPHTNMTKEQWEKVFQELNLKITDVNIHDFWRFFTSGTFFLERS
jgi:ubiquinone/menaquinone biosynthesis C-methylase UbiE